MLFTFVYLYSGICVLPSCNALPTGVINAPCVEGVETKSKQSNSKSSCTSTVPLAPSFTEPIPLEEIPTVIPDANNACNIFPAGVGNIYTSP